MFISTTNLAARRKLNPAKGHEVTSEEVIGGRVFGGSVTLEVGRNLGRAREMLHTIWNLVYENILI